MEVRINQTERRSWVEIDLEQLKANYTAYQGSLPLDTKIMAVIKADAYGHGDYHIAKYLHSLGCTLFAVSNIDEAICLREAEVKGEILILGYTSPRFAKELVKYELTQTLVSDEHAEALVKTGYPIKCQFAVDTGMNRIGLKSDTPTEIAKTIRHYANLLPLNGIFTHLCVADDLSTPSKDFTKRQVDFFRNLSLILKDLDLSYIHCFNSAGGLYSIHDEDAASPINKIVRLGISLYGYPPDSTNQLPTGVGPILTWKSTISVVKTVKEGETIGYGRTYMADKPAKIATITTGYADGLNRLLSNKGHVIIKGKQAPIVGRICMDQIMVDVSHLPEVNMGDTVIIIGHEGEEHYTADDMAKDLNTISYEVLCGISKRVQRFYKAQGLLYTL